MEWIGEKEGARDELKRMANTIIDELIAIHAGMNSVDDEAGEAHDMADWLNQQLDVSVYKNIKSNCGWAEVLITFGGPNIVLSTRHNEICATWGGDAYEGRVPPEICEEIESICIHF